MSIGTTGAIIAAATIGAGASVASGALGSHAASQAAQTQAESGQAAIDEQRRQFDINQQNIAPWLAAGRTALGDLMGRFESGEFGTTPPAPAAFAAPTLEQARATPGYQFTLEQGLQAAQRSAAARGGLLGGGTMKALAQYGTGLADSTYGDVFSRALDTYRANLAGYSATLAGQSQAYNQLAGVSGAGQTAVQDINQLGQSSATNIGNLMTQMGNAQAAGTMGGANAWGSAFGNIANIGAQIPWYVSQNPGGGAMTRATVPVPADYQYGVG